jgi:hypothetical protein
MGTAQTIQTGEGATTEQRACRWWHLPEVTVPTLRNVRTRRIVLVLTLIWIVGAFDLVFTLIALRLGGFQEANPLAREFIHRPAILATFKFSTLALSTTLLLLFSRRRLAEIGCWIVGFVHVLLAFVWLVYFFWNTAGV